MRSLIYSSLLIMASLCPQITQANPQTTPFKENPAWQLLKTDQASYGVEAIHAVVESKSHSAYLDIQCNTDQSLEVNIAWPTPIDTTQKSIDFKIKVDQKPSTYTFFLKNDQMVSFVDKARPFLDQLYGHKTLEMTIPFMDMGETQIIFDIDHIQQVQNTLETLCRS